MHRRTFMVSSAAAAGLAVLEPTHVLARASKLDWTPLRKRLGRRLIDIHSPLVECARSHCAGADRLFAALKNPYYLSDEPSLTQSLGWIEAWTSQPSLKGVAAETAGDVAAAVNFARQNGVVPVVKGGGHSYFGNSNRAGSLLIWTHRLRAIDMHDSFRAVGQPAGKPSMPAVSLGAGCLWGEVYRKVAIEHGRYVQGGGCLTVGVAGLVQGGGFGSLSKQFGTAAANLLEAEVVTADGHIRTVNDWQQPELFFALRGGGGGTFGVVTRLTLKTHPLPTTIGAAEFSIQAINEANWRELVARIVDFYADHLFGPTWGEQIRFSPGYRLGVNMLCHGMTKEEMTRTWDPFLAWARSRPNDFTIKDEPQMIAVPARALWDPAQLRRIPGSVMQDDRPGAPAENIYWAGNRGEAGQVLHAYKSAWLPKDLLAIDQRRRLTETFVNAGNIWSITWHTNKGLGGGDPQAIAATRATATNAEVLDAFALVICAAEEDPAWPGIPGHEPNVAEGRRQAASVAQAMAEVYKLVPKAGAYMSECDFFLKDWKRAQWGSNYSRLAAAKRRYDPASLFHGHHCVEPD